MVDIYAPWCENLPENKEALKILKDSGLISGVESRNWKDKDKINQAGLKFSLHNPKGKFYLESPKFMKKIREEPEILYSSDTPFISFHAGYSTDEDGDILNILKNIQKNVNKLRKITDKRIIFETPAYNPEKHNTIRNYASTPQFMKLVKDFNIGYLFDISHVFVSAKAHETKFKSADEYIEDVLIYSNRDIPEVHLNLPKDGLFFKDKHKAFIPGDPFTEIYMELTKKVVAYSRNLEIITLEINTKSPPIEHAKKIIEQAEYVTKRLF